MAGINGEHTDKQLTLNLPFLKNRKGEMIGSGNGEGDEPSLNIKNINVTTDGKIRITLKGHDGFVILF